MVRLSTFLMIITGGVCLLGAAACSKKPSGGSAQAEQSARTSSALASSGTAGADSAGPAVEIPPGALQAGTSCIDQPRSPNEELAGVSIALGGFSIDKYPYPNDPTKPPLTNVSQAEAKAKCEARGRRLCTELEWERACKGPDNTKYEYGARFDAKKCPTGWTALGAPEAYPDCHSAFGVQAMHGFVWEWTASAWGRGTEGNQVTLRGGYGKSPYANMRCTNVQASDPAAKTSNVGFRCCGGPENAAKVELPKPDPNVPQLEPVESFDDALSARLERALRNGDLLAVSGVDYHFEKVWRWHPVPNEDLYVAKYVAKADGKTWVQPIVVQFCPGLARLVGRLRGPVEDLGEPRTETQPDKNAPDRQLLLFTAHSGSDSGELRLEYRYGQVSVTQPPWLQPNPAVLTERNAKGAASAAPASSRP